MKIIKASLKIFKFIFIGVLAAAVLINLISIFKRLVLKDQLPLVFGYGNAVVITGSMEPAILPGDLIIVHRQDSYEIGDIVAYRGTNNPITHRIVGKTANGFVTQGDANNKDDGEIPKSQIIGKVVEVIPRFGNVILFFQRPLGVLILIVGLAAIIEVPRLIKDRKETTGENAT